jgi:hypothetical protein
LDQPRRQLSWTVPNSSETTIGDVDPISVQVRKVHALAFPDGSAGGVGRSVSRATGLKASFSSPGVARNLARTRTMMNEETVGILLAVYRQAKTCLPFDQQTEQGRAALAARIFALAKADEHTTFSLLSAAIVGARQERQTN